MFFLNYDQVPFLACLLMSPLIGGGLLLCIKPSNNTNLTRGLIWIQSTSIILILLLSQLFDPHWDGFQCTEKVLWIPRLSLHYDLAVDVRSLTCMLLAALVFPAATALSTVSEISHLRAYVAFSLIIEVFVFGTMCFNNIVLFYLFYEMTFVAFLLMFQFTTQIKDLQKNMWLYLCLSSLFLFLSLVQLSHTGASAFDIARYETVNRSVFWEMVCCVAILLRLELLVRSIRQGGTLSHNLLALGPVFLSQALPLFRVQELFQTFTASQWVLWVAFGLIFINLAELQKALNHRHNETAHSNSVLPLLSSLTFKILILLNFVELRNPVKGLFLISSYTFSIACLSLSAVASFRNAKMTWLAKGSTSLVALSLFGFPCSSSFWAYIGLLQEFIGRNQVVNAVLLLCVFIAQISMGSKNRNLIPVVCPPNGLQSSGIVSLFWLFFGFTILTLLIPLIL